MDIYVLPIFILTIFLFSLIKKRDGLEDFKNGLIEGVNILKIIIPYIVAIMFSTKIFIYSDFFNNLFSLIGESTNSNYFLQSILRSVSHNSSLSVMVETFNKFGIDSKNSIKSSVLQGSTDTTIYICTLYFGSVGVKGYKVVIILGLIVDLIASITVYLLFI